MSRSSSRKVTVITVGRLPTEPPGARGAVSSTPRRIRPGVTPTSSATRPTRLSPVSTIGTRAGFVPGVDTGVPETLVAWPTNSSAVAV